MVSRSRLTTSIRTDKTATSYVTKGKEKKESTQSD